ncbi:hypothetical protein [Arthrobacter pityocampae]|uniref:hypothetical protein n=1 Tax=Arthrobacter pityocampae TaxID=547334 RepID=UPI0011B02F6D|nr:hypothetical protein [Arthrobacter pityocampae]
MIIVFSSIRKSPELLDFIHEKPLLSNNRSHILWVFDDFGPEYSYYLCHERRFEIQRAVVELIRIFKRSLGLHDTDCTAVGMSKGGTAAIMVGIEAGCSNIVASSPQIAIGDYLKNRKRFPIIEFMSGKGDDSDVQWLNRLVVDRITADPERSRNFYLLTSPYDPHCIDYLSTVQSRLDSYSNFNFISTASDLCRNHTQTLQYNVPLVLNILGLLAEGLRPRLGATSNGYGFDDSGHRDRHLLLSSRFGGSLE